MTSTRSDPLLASLDEYSNLTEALAGALTPAPSLCQLCGAPATGGCLLSLPAMRMLVPIGLCKRCRQRVRKSASLRAKIEGVVLNHTDLADAEAGRPC